jgi:phosphoserine phosphatase
VLDLDGTLIEGEDWDAVRERLIVSGEADGFRRRRPRPRGDRRPNPPRGRLKQLPRVIR